MHDVNAPRRSVASLSAVLRTPVRSVKAKVQSLAATTAGAHIGGAAGIIGLRVVAVVQLAGALLGGSLSHARNPIIAGLLASLFLIQSVVVVAVLWRRRSPVQPGLCLLDVIITAVVLLGQISYAPPETSYSTWDAWGYGVSNPTVLFAAMAFPKVGQAIIAAFVITAAYVVSIGPPAIQQGHPTTVFTNASGYLFNTLVCRFVWSYLVRLAREADAARGLAAEAARREERSKASTEQEVLAARADAVRAHDKVRYQFMLHDTTGLMETMRREIERHKIDDPAVLDSLARIRALTLQFRALLDGEDSDADTSALGGRLRALGLPFGDLNLVTNVDTVDDLKLPGQQLDLIESAVRTLLNNVRRHARATQTVLHATTFEGQWEISVRDDGQGWDTSQPLGWGLKEQVIGAMARIGAEVAIESGPEGTAVQIRGPLNVEES